MRGRKGEEEEEEEGGTGARKLQRADACCGNGSRHLQLSPETGIKSPH